jgi:hypothetical protein
MSEETAGRIFQAGRTVLSSRVLEQGMARPSRLQDWDELLAAVQVLAVELPDFVEELHHSPTLRAENWVV